MFYILFKCKNYLFTALGCTIYIYKKKKLFTNYSEYQYSELFYSALLKRTTGAQHHSTVYVFTKSIVQVGQTVLINL